ncbi:MAG: hypothetical protein NTW18_01015 [Candidatus Omnitrophica bacterium]|nr:hypothetical protein [Candidatus Omnitrophota bacterium]
MINLIVVNAIVIFSSWIIARKYFGVRLFSELILVWFILFFAQIVLVEMILGIFNLLFFKNVFSVHLLILIFILLISRKRRIAEFLKPDLEFFVNSKLLFFAFSVFAAFFLVRIVINLMTPAVFPDGLQIYLSFPATWIKSGNLDNPVNIFGASPILNAKFLQTSATSYYPINGQLFFAWLMLPLRSSFLANIGQAPFYITGIAVFYSILRKYDLNRTIALLSGFLWALIPNIFKQFRNGAQIDIICSVLVLLFFYTILLLKLNFTFKNVILFGISAGLLIGTKVINIVWFAAFLPFTCYVLFNGIKENKLTMSKVLNFTGVIALMVILFGGFIYIKNYIFTGNPLFPVSLKVFGVTIFNGLLDNAAYGMQIASGDKFDLMRIIFKEGLGAQFLVLVLPGLFLPVVFFAYLRRKCQPFGEYVLIFITPLIMFFLYYFLVNVYVVRYLFPFISMGLITAVIFISRLPRGERYLTLVSFIAIFVSASELAHRYELITSLLLSLIFFIALVAYKKQFISFYKSKAFTKKMIILLSVVLIFLGYLNEKYNKEAYDRYPLSFSKKEASQRDIARGWKALNDLTGPGARVAYTGRQEFYPLFGTRLKNYVVYVSINEKEVSPYNEFDGLFRQTKDFLAWRINLKREKIEYLFIAHPFFNSRESEDPAKFPVEDEWAVAHPEDFKLLYNNSLAHIYKILIK